MFRTAFRLTPLLVFLVGPTGAASQGLTAEAANRSLEEMQWRQCELNRDIREALSSAPASAEELQALRDRKDSLHEEIARLESELDVAARAEPATNLPLAHAAVRIRESQLKETVLYSRGTLDQWDFGSIERIEQLILDRLQAVRSELRQPGNPVTCPELG